MSATVLKYWGTTPKFKNKKAQLIVKEAEKLYPYVETGLANIARAKAVYDASCRKKK